MLRSSSSFSNGCFSLFVCSGIVSFAVLEWLIANCEDYRDITINEENLARYASDGDIELPTVDEAKDEKEKKSKTTNDIIPEQTNNEKHPFENEDEDLNMAYEEYVESLGDIPKPTNTVNENIATDTIDNYVKKAIEELQVRISFEIFGKYPLLQYTNNLSNEVINILATNITRAGNV